jgi:16S rRNA processing protein RimM
MQKKKRILIGKILGPHGIKGLVRIKSEASPPESIFKLGLFLHDDTSAKLSKVGVCKDGFICKIDSSQTRDEAESFSGKSLFVNREDLPTQLEEEFYIADLVGCRVFLAGSDIGCVTAVYNFGAGDILEIKFANDKTELFPFNKITFPRIDIDNNYVELVYQGEEND